MKKTIKWLFVMLLSILILIQAYALIKCEILTVKYHSEFEEAYRDNVMLDEMESFKVLECNGADAQVYYISERKTSGDILSFEKVGNRWVETGWETVWSIDGSASEVIWPYWWHFVYGGF